MKGSNFDSLVFSCVKKKAGTSDRYFMDWTSDLRIRALRISKRCISQAWMKTNTKRGGINAVSDCLGRFTET